MNKVVTNIVVGGAMIGMYLAGNWTGYTAGKRTGKTEACTKILEKLSKKYIGFTKEGELNAVTWLKAVPETIVEVSGVELDTKAGEA